ncbi:tetratricopeptide repeat protein [Kingella sp. SNUBH-2017]|jgi:conserved domain protein|uniref:Tetratricopeptide repeat protein n=1 Tax=Kingella pumchi TaxID=2779506 RepID=A0ABS9NNB0_9NEIS|nr:MULTISPECIES: tetratricopeptide repeat protein [Kingella]MCG6503808.1 tetratricopeptide repeat protein [Kingella pumchi]MDD2183426.1 tetratricopeptide repeat protein [Kingella sp. SNUBH-2017]
MYPRLTALLLAAAVCVPAVYAAPKSAPQATSNAPAQAESPVPNHMPDDMRRRVEAAMALLQRGQAAQALPQLDKLVAEAEATLKRDTQNRVYAADDRNFVIASLLEAAKRKQSAVVVSTDWIAPLYARAYALIELGQLDRARADLDRVLAISPYTPRALGERAQISMHRKDFAAAEVDLNKMREYGKMSANPADAIGYQGFALRGLGYIAVERKQWDKALGFYNEALKLNPNDDKAKAEIDFIRHSRR